MRVLLEQAQEWLLPDRFAQMPVGTIWHVSRVNDGDHDHRDLADHRIGLEVMEKVATVARSMFT